jgi:hypothetical protein
VTQPDLWHDTFEDALKSVLTAVYGKGWNKKAAAEMWPTDDCYDKGKYLEKALTTGRNEKLGLSEIVWIIRKGRDAGIHTAFAFLASECNYEYRAVEPEERKAELVDRVSALLAQAAQLTKQLEGIK